jgi:farnesyl-diphosphate farnesyltransferase
MKHLDEVFAAFTFLYVKPLKSNLDTTYIRKTFDKEALEFCDEILVKVSRSFAAVIQQLPSNMLVDILVFYLVLRALDTIEDDTTAFANNELKINELKNFRAKALADPNWNMDGVGEADELRLLQDFPKCHRVYAALNPRSRAIIDDITQRMADGMAEFVGKDLGQGTKDISEYNRYCHFVAGLVGEGLSRLFAQSGLETEAFGQEVHLSDQMGLFLQKTNIIRDYLEDYVDGRAFWPQSVWKKYSKSGDLGYFAKQEDADAKAKALECLNELVTDALELVPDCLTYMSKLRCSEIFRFCAIPQVMAIATLDKCFANPKVFTGVVKIRKGTSCKLILRTNTLDEVHETFYIFAQSIISKAKKQKAAGVIDPTYHRTMKACDTILEWTQAGYYHQSRARRVPVILSAGLLAAAGVITLGSSSSISISSSSDLKGTLGATLVGMAGLVYTFGFDTLRSRSSLVTAQELSKTL